MQLPASVESHRPVDTPLSCPGLTFALAKLRRAKGPLLILTHSRVGAWNTGLSHRSDAQILKYETPPTGHAGWEPFQQAVSQPKVYEVIVLDHTFQLMDPIYALTNCHDLLESDGRLLITGYFSRDRQAPALDEFPYLPFFLNQAKRCGFRIEDQTGVPGLSEMETDHRGKNQFLVLKRIRRPKYQLATADDRLNDEIAVLFKAVFGHEMSPEWRRWKYGEGRGGAVVIYRDGQMVGHYGGIKRNVLREGIPCQATQPVDVMVLPSDRYPRGPFYLGATTFLEQNMGYGTPSPIGFGFPNRRAMRLGEALKIYYEVDRICEVRWPAEADHNRGLIGLADGVALKKRDLIVDALWAKMQKDLSAAIVGVRDAAYVRHRYLDHPGIQYELLVARHRITRQPRGLVVLKREEQQCLLLDYVGPLTQLPQIIGLTRRWIHDHRIPSLYTWITASKKQYFESTQGQFRDLDISVPGNQWTVGPLPEQLRDKWWLMPGDTDFL